MICCYYNRINPKPWKLLHIQSIQSVKWKKSYLVILVLPNTILAALNHMWSLVKRFQKVFYVLVYSGLADARTSESWEGAVASEHSGGVLKGSVLPGCSLLFTLFVEERKYHVLARSSLNKLLKHQETIGLGKSWVLAFLTVCWKNYPERLRKSFTI